MKPARTLAVAAALLTGTVACTGDDTSADDMPEPERIEYVNADVPEDRAEDAVDAALGHLDPCALVDPQGVGVKHLSGGDVEALSPHTCEVSNGMVKVSVQIGSEFSTEERYNAGVDALGGAKAYVVPTDTLGMCKVALPVDFTRSIMFVGAYSAADDRDACDNAKAFAAAGAKRLDEPDGVTHEEGSARQTACDILRPAIELTDETELRSGWNFGQGVDECGVWPKAGDGGLEPSAPDVGLAVQYRESLPDYYRQAGTVQGRQLRAYHCAMSWNERKARTPNSAGKVVFEVTAPSCKKAKKLVAEIADVIDRDRVRKPAEPQRPVLYAPGEPDSPAPGACADVVDPVESKCQPYAKADAPTDGKETIKAAGEDPDVNCAIAAEAIEEHYGAHLRPVTAVRGIGALDSAGRMCGFVEESHATEIWIGVSNETMSESAASEIAGHPAHDETTESNGERTISVALGDEDEAGYLYGEVLVRPSRDAGDLDDAPVDEAPMQKLDEVLTDVVENHFDAR